MQPQAARGAGRTEGESREFGGAEGPPFRQRPTLVRSPGQILSLMPKFASLPNVLLTMFNLWLDALRFIGVSLWPRRALAAENLSLRKQWALYLERRVKPPRVKMAAQ